MTATEDGTGERHAAGNAHVRLFDHDPTLLSSVDGPHVAFLREHGTVPSVQLQPGAWHPPTHRPSTSQWLGLHVLEGFAARPLIISGRRVNEVVGPGDILRPWDQETWSALVDVSRPWVVLAPMTLAVLDQRFAAVACRSPQLVNELLRRSLRRASQLAAGVSIADMPELDAKLSALLDYLRTRWGVPTSDGVEVPPQFTETAMAVVLQVDRAAVRRALERVPTAPDRRQRR